MHQHIDRFVYYCDKDGSVLSEKTVPFEPSVAIMNEWRYNYGQASSWAGITQSYPMERALRNNKMFYPVYVLDAAKYAVNWDWAKINANLTDWNNPDELCAGLGKAFLVMAAKIALYLFQTFPQYLVGPRGNKDWRHNNDDVYYDYKNGDVAFRRMVKWLCEYFGVTYRESGKVKDSYGLLYSPAYEMANEALYSLAYALWYGLDGAREKWRVNVDYLQKYDAFADAYYPKVSFYDALKDSFATYNAILELSTRFQRQY